MSCRMHTCHTQDASISDAVAQRQWQGGYGAAAAAHLVAISRAKQAAIKEARERMDDVISSIAH